MIFLSAFHASSRGETMSPAISIVSFSFPKADVGLDAFIGVNFAIGTPNFVITISFLVSFTSSISLRHLLLNSPAAICIMTMVI